LKLPRNRTTPIKIIVTAGPTIEPIDPVRFISNRSTGYMGYKIAEAASKRKHAVTLISGPVSLKPPKVKKFIRIETAKELLSVLKKEVKKSDCLVMCAAVSDFRPGSIARKKIKRTKALSIKLIPNKDLLEELSLRKKSNLFAGFSLETENLDANAREKLKLKKLDIIMANRLSKTHNPFGANKLDMIMIDVSGHRLYIRKKSKSYIADVLLDKIEELWYQKR
jgi:phosphopantothenoylcysteine decarboxylase / phosphopantothenate---cysteine ligase